MRVCLFFIHFHNTTPISTIFAMVKDLPGKGLKTTLIPFYIHVTNLLYRNTVLLKSYGEKCYWPK